MNCRMAVLHVIAGIQAPDVQEGCCAAATFWARVTGTLPTPWGWCCAGCTRSTGRGAGAGTGGNGEKVS